MGRQMDAIVPEKVRRYEISVRSLFPFSSALGDVVKVFEAYEAAKRARLDPTIPLESYEWGRDFVAENCLSQDEPEIYLNLVAYLERSVPKARESPAETKARHERTAKMLAEYDREHPNGSPE